MIWRYPYFRKPIILHHQIHELQHAPAHLFRHKQLTMLLSAISTCDAKVEFGLLKRPKPPYSSPSYVVPFLSV